MSEKPLKLKLVQKKVGQGVVAGELPAYDLEYDGMPVANSNVKTEPDGYSVMVGDGTARGLKVNGRKQYGMQLCEEEKEMFLYVDNLVLTRETEEYRPGYKKTYFMHDNRHPHFSGWYRECHSREAAFRDAQWYLDMRVTSGLPTKKPYIITIEEWLPKKRGPRKVKNAWDIKLEIKKK